MKESVEFIIYNNEKPVKLFADVAENNHLYRCGKLIYCNCNKDKPEPYTYNDGTVYCPLCGRKAQAMVVSDNEDLKLDYIGLDKNTMQELYKLSDTIPYNVWNTISEYFVKLTPDDVDLGYDIGYVGWVTSNPYPVEEILNIKTDNRLVNREKTIIKKTVESYNKDYIFDIVDKLHEVFSVVETPPGEFQLYESTPGEEYGVWVENPLFPPNKHGNGEFWVLKKARDEIWYVRYNFRPGDDRRFNNVLIDFELKAIGKKIPYDPDVAELIKKLQK